MQTLAFINQKEIQKPMKSYTHTEILQLSPQERLAGYLYWEAKVAFIGATLRTKYKDVATDYYEGWSPEEENEWNDAVDQHEMWFMATPIEERNGPILEFVSNVLNPLSRGRIP